MGVFGFSLMLRLGIILLGFLADMTCGKIHTQFFTKHYQSIESYIMNGYGKRSGYKCDVIYDNAQNMKGRVQFGMDLDKLKHFDSNI